MISKEKHLTIGFGLLLVIFGVPSFMFFFHFLIFSITEAEGVLIILAYFMLMLSVLFTLFGLNLLINTPNRNRKRYLKKVNKDEECFYVECKSRYSNETKSMAEYLCKTEEYEKILRNKGFSINKTKATLLIQIQWTIISSGTYTDGSSGYRVNCSFNIKDNISKRNIFNNNIIFSKFFFGSGIPGYINKYSNKILSVYGETSRDQVLKLLESIEKPFYITM